MVLGLSGRRAIIESAELRVGSFLLCSWVRGNLGSVPSEGPNKGQAALLLDGAAQLQLDVKLGADTGRHGQRGPASSTQCEVRPSAGPEGTSPTMKFCLGSWAQLSSPGTPQRGMCPWKATSVSGLPQGQKEVRAVCGTWWLYPAQSLRRPFPTY